jgi:hypothetical protein
MNLKINSLKEVEADSWNGFDDTSAHPANTTFYANLYQKAGSCPIFLEAYAGDIKVSQWLLCRYRPIFNPFKTELLSRCGPQIINFFIDQYDEIFCKYIEYVSLKYSPRNITLLQYALVRGIPFSALEKCGFKRVTKYLSYINPIIDDEAILRRFHTSHRNDARKALRERFKYEPQITPDDYHRLSLETYQRSKKSGPSWGDIRDIYNKLIIYEKGLISGVYVKNKLCTATVILYHGENAYYLYGASASEKPRGATVYIHFENMRYLRKKGVKRYDFGGAMIAGTNDEKAISISLFKKRFGGDQVDAYGAIYR